MSSTYSAVTQHAGPSVSRKTLNLHTLLMISITITGASLSSFISGGELWYRAYNGDLEWTHVDITLLTFFCVVFIVSLCTAIITQRKLVAHLEA